MTRFSELKPGDRFYNGHTRGGHTYVKVGFTRAQSVVEGPDDLYFNVGAYYDDKLILPIPEDQGKPWVPLFIHDCESCKYLGRTWSERHDKQVDLWVCPKADFPADCVVRYGNEGPEYNSWDENTLSTSLDVWGKDMAECFRRALEFGYIEEESKRSCDDCRHCFNVDYGYSNYTTEGTEIYCEIDAHPDAPFDRFYGEDPRLNFASRCKSFSEGEGISMDVDREQYDDLSPEDKASWDEWGKA